MRKQLSLLIFSLFFFSISFAQKLSKTDEEIIDLIIKSKDNQYIEFYDMYDSETSVIQDDEKEKLIIVQLLKKKGFDISNWGRGNHTLGPRIISIKMHKEGCECDVEKIYYSTGNDDIFQMRERIKCYNPQNKK